LAQREIVWTIVVAGGSGERFGGPKQYEKLGPLRVLDHSMAAANEASDGVVLVVPPVDAEREGGVAGGTTRCGSVRAGLEAVPEEATIVCVHDAARPFATHAAFVAVVTAVAGGADGAVPGLPISDTVKRVDEGRRVIETLPRASLFAAQTPQAFRASVLREAHRDGGEATDDAALVEAVGGTVVVVDGDATNRKITCPDDLAWARSRIAEELR